MDVICTYEERNLIVCIHGEVDHHTSEEIREKMEKEYERHRAKNIIFDLEGVTFMDSSGLGLIIGRYKAIEGQGGRVVVAKAGSSVSRILQISGLHKIIESYPDIPSAVAALEAGKGNLLR